MHYKVLDRSCDVHENVVLLQSEHQKARHLHKPKLQNKGRTLRERIGKAHRRTVEKQETQHARLSMRQETAQKAADCALLPVPTEADPDVIQRGQGCCDRWQPIGWRWVCKDEASKPQMDQQATGDIVAGWARCP